jgi:phosphate transport system substrate-binding protein
MAYVKAPGVKALPIDGVAASVQTVQGHTYSYWRPTFYYTNGEPSGVAKQFLDFTTGAAGQKIVAQVGFVPIK